MAQTDDMRVGAPSYFEPEVLDGTLVFRLGYDAPASPGLPSNRGLGRSQGRSAARSRPFYAVLSTSRVPVAPMQVFTP